MTPRARRKADKCGEQEMSSRDQNIEALVGFDGAQVIVFRQVNPGNPRPSGSGKGDEHGKIVLPLVLEPGESRAVEGQQPRFIFLDFGGLKGLTTERVVDFPNGCQARAALRRGLFDKQFGQVAKGDHIAVAVEHEGSSIFADFQVADENRKLIDFDVDPDHAHELPVSIEKRSCDGDSRFPGGIENVGIRPDDVVFGDGFPVPGALTWIVRVRIVVSFRIG